MKTILKMKMKLVLAFLFAALLFLISPRAQAQPFSPERDGWVTQTNAGSTLASVLFSANLYDGPRLTFIHATSDLAGSVIAIYTGLNESTVISNSAAAAATIFVADSSQFAVNDMVMIQSRSNSVQRGVVSAIVNATNLTLSTTFASQTASIGDTLHQLRTPVTLPVGAATVTFAAEGIASARRARPMVITLNGTTTCKIHAATVRYDAP